MNEEGWIDLSFIAQFNRVKFFSADMEYIAESSVTLKWWRWEGGEAGIK